MSIVTVGENPMSTVRELSVAVPGREGWEARLMSPRITAHRGRHRHETSLSIRHEKYGRLLPAMSSIFNKKMLADEHPYEILIDSLII